MHVDSEPAVRSMIEAVVGVDHIAEVVSRWTHIPVTKLQLSERVRLLNLHERLKERVQGQEEACEAVANAIVRARAGFNSTTQPDGEFLFMEPTGVGKTELAKA